MTADGRRRLVAALLVVACAVPEPAPAPPVTSPAGHVQSTLPEATGPIEPALKDSSPPAPPPASEPPPAPPVAIVDRPITYDEARIARTIAYRKAHQDPAAAGIEIEPRMIVLHHTGGGSADATWRYFDRPTIESGRKTIAAAGDLNVSSQFLVDRDGTIFRLMPETSMARHCVGLNHVAIGVENVGDLEDHPLTDAQVAADAALVRHLKARFPAITHLIGHHEYLAMEGHPYFVERDPKYRTRKADPGPAFMAKVRAQVADLGLEGPPVR
ncbi:N-acetylmuramoyl-L-alanine amidase [Nannocystis radixulma]|uniref:N-acetylmuramoyl-L-alanine amidase n=1 Tax=Nannocystis radixulma TaxID=2995305 RepID=A0ABT5BE12_9BACT|nr:peptidoglycan recognition family protein [Nannocystis radixulma]MDC0671744.1 peptidoglycan recognition family protein [Nannocystis radixulma]